MKTILHRWCDWWVSRVTRTSHSIGWGFIICKKVACPSSLQKNDFFTGPYVDAAYRSTDAVRPRPTCSESKDVTSCCPGNGSQYEGEGGRVPHIKRNFLTGAEVFVRPWIDS